MKHHPLLCKCTKTYTPKQCLYYNQGFVAAMFEIIGKFRTQGPVGEPFAKLIEKWYGL